MPHIEQLTPEEQVEAIDKKDFETLRDMIQKGQLSLTSTLKSTTALHLIVTYKKHSQLLEWILKNRHEINEIINARNDTQCTPLIMAADVSNLENMKILIEHGANTNLQNMYGQTARDVLVSKKLSNQIAWFDQTVKAYQDKKNSNQSLQSTKKPSSNKPQSFLSSFSFLSSCLPLSKKEDKQLRIPLVKGEKEKTL